MAVDVRILGAAVAGAPDGRPLPGGESPAALAAPPPEPAGGNAGGTSPAARPEPAAALAAPGGMRPVGFVQPVSWTTTHAGEGGGRTVSDCAIRSGWIDPAEIAAVRGPLDDYGEIEKNAGAAVVEVTLTGGANS